MHRLDKDTSGLMVVAKTELAHARARAPISPPARIDARLSRRGLGRAAARAQGEIAGRIGRSPRNRKKMAVLTQRRQGRRSRATGCCARFGTCAALVECRLATGRTHQIRVHLTRASAIR